MFAHFTTFRLLVLLSRPFAIATHSQGFEQTDHTLRSTGTLELDYI